MNGLAPGDYATEPNGRVPKGARMREPEPQFDHIAKQDRAWSHRMMYILAVGLGPSLILGILGYYDAALTAFLVSFGGGFLLIYTLQKLDEWEGFETPRQKLLLFAILLLHLGFELIKIGWQSLFDLAAQ